MRSRSCSVRRRFTVRQSVGAESRDLASNDSRLHLFLPVHVEVRLWATIPLTQRPRQRDSRRLTKLVRAVTLNNSSRGETGPSETERVTRETSVRRARLGAHDCPAARHGTTGPPRASLNSSGLFAGAAAS